MREKQSWVIARLLAIRAGLVVLSIHCLVGAHSLRGTSGLMGHLASVASTLMVASLSVILLTSPFALCGIRMPSNRSGRLTFRGM